MTRVITSQASIATGDPIMSLTPKQKIFVESLIKGQTQSLAARSAGYSNIHVEANRLMQMPKIHEAVAYLHRKHEKASQMTRKKVMDGLLEAIEMAKMQAEPATMVNGWREIGRMCGYYAAERKILDVNITAKRAVASYSFRPAGQMMTSQADSSRGWRTQRRTPKSSRTSTNSRLSATRRNRRSGSMPTPRQT